MTAFPGFPSKTGRLIKFNLLTAFLFSEKKKPYKLIINTPNSNSVWGN